MFKTFKANWPGYDKDEKYWIISGISMMLIYMIFFIPILIRYDGLSIQFLCLSLIAMMGIIYCIQADTHRVRRELKELIKNGKKME